MRAVALVLLVACRAEPERPPGCEGRQISGEGAAHIPDGTDATYASNPPASGPHAAPLGAGKYRSEQRRESWVHNLEHGEIALLYNCPAGCDDVQGALERIHDETSLGRLGQRVVLVTPDSRMPHRIAAIAWTWLLELDAMDEAAVRCFIETHRERGPE